MCQVFDNTITSKWKTEALSSGQDVSEKMIDWCIAELQYKAGVFKDTGLVSVYTGDVVKSDVAIPTSLQEELKAAVLLLEDIVPKDQCWTCKLLHCNECVQRVQRRM